jgi:hypothetical protein
MFALRKNIIIIIVAEESFGVELLGRRGLRIYHEL